MKCAVLVDFSHMFHRCHSIALKAPPEFDLIDTTVYHFKGVLRTLDKQLAKMKINQYDLVFAEDRPAHRKLALHPGYRAGRINKSEDKVSVKQKLIAEGVTGHWCYSEGNEADDVIATLVRLAEQNQGMFTVIVSGDQDLWQLISPSTVVFNPNKKELVTPSSTYQVTDIHSVSPCHIALVKALWGDTTDCIPNACPRTQKHLLDLIRQSRTGDIEEFKGLLKERWSQLSPRCREILSEGAEQVEVNWKLVKLDSNCTLIWK